MRGVGLMGVGEELRNWWVQWRQPRVWGRALSELTIVLDEPAAQGLLRPEANIQSLVIRPAWGRDHNRLEIVRRSNRSWLGKWEATLPPGSDEPILTLQAFRRHIQLQMEAGEALTMIIEADGEAVGTVSLGGVLRGAVSSGNLGYWIGEKWSRLGITSLAVGAVIDLVIKDLGLHRVEVNIRPENEASLSVARSLGLRHEGLRRRYMCIAGQWSDHQGFAIDQEDLRGGGLVETRLRGRYLRTQNELETQIHNSY